MPVDELGYPRMTDPRLLRDKEPFPPAVGQVGAYAVFERSDVHARNIAKFCYSSKQHFAKHSIHTPRMSKQNINDVLADNLAHFMEERRVTQRALAQQSGIAQTTISLYLNPQRRQPGKSGKIPSAKLTEVESLAHALGVDAWKLIRPMTPEQRKAYDSIEQAYLAIVGASNPPDNKSAATG